MPEVPEEKKLTDIDVESAMSGNDGKPFVELKIDSENGSVNEKMRPDKAREIAVMLFESAVEAERDAAFMFGMQAIDFDRDTAGRMLMLIREHRAQFEGLQ